MFSVSPTSKQANQPDCGAARLRVSLSTLLLISSVLLAGCKPEPIKLQYLANEGVAVFHNDTTLLFDPLFREGFNTYHLPAPATRAALLTAQAPFAEVDAVFVSHHHGDHFDPADMLELLVVHSEASLYAPTQATDAMRRHSPRVFEDIKHRIVSFDLNYESPPQSIKQDMLLIEAFFVPHAGWPTARTEVQNIAFRISIGGQNAISHFGDADPNRIHFSRHENTWLQRASKAALPPYWFFSSRDGKNILKEIVRAEHSIGVHVPVKYSRTEDLPDELRGVDLFLEPGSTRLLDGNSHSH